MRTDGDYISREALLSATDGYDWQAGLKTVLKRIPAADVRPVRRGKWSKELHPRTKYNQFRCSVCGKFSGQDEEGWIWKPNFCPNCGARMEES